MYLQHFGLTEKPFELSPDPKFLFLTPGHREALQAVRRGIEGSKGLIVLTGEVGTGKTIIIHGLLDALPENIKTALIFHPTFKFRELLEQIFQELGETGIKGGMDGLRDHLVAYLEGLRAKGELLAVCIDEAQKLSEEVVKELFLLFELKPWLPEVFQLVLVGQPELENLLEAARLRYRPRAPGLRVKIGPLTERESLEYIKHRLRIAGGGAQEIFSQKALSLIIGYAGGVPRKINIVCDNALLAGYGESLKTIDDRVIRGVVANLEGPGEKKKIKAVTVREVEAGRPLSLLAWRYGLIAVLILVLGIVLYWAGAERKGGESQPKAPQAVESPRIADVQKTDRIPPAAPQEAVEKQTGPAGPENSVTGAKPDTTEPKEVHPKEAAFQTIKVNGGENLFRLAFRQYGRTNASLVDLILFNNPSITDADLILIDQKIKIPALQVGALLAPSPDRTIAVHLGTFPSLKQAELFKASLPLLKGGLVVQARTVSPETTWYRVESRGYKSKREALEDIRVLKEKGLLPFFGP